ncbi:hypothetical protein K438DRAFT_583770 [Mycena galopus ATCC 62051]|nr:hypothetical protein K438DRAFT_583770 [Mycena galopus ATCC 62051]
MFNHTLTDTAADGWNRDGGTGGTDVPVLTAPRFALSSRRPPNILPSNSKMRLSIELVECIIDVSRPHPPTLAACSLVCRQWLPRSRYHLFSSLDLSADWNPEPNAVTEFINIIDAPIANSTLIPYVMSVVLSKRSWGMTPVQRILATLARSGIHPAFLHINCPTYEPTHFPVFSSSLVHLALYLHTDMPMPTLIDHICVYPFLESLYIGGSARYAITGQPLSTKPPARLKTLIISDPVFAEWILSLDPMPTQISTVVLRDVRLPHQWSAINRYFDSPAAAAIRSLTFHGCDSKNEHDPPDLRHLVALQDLIVEHTSPILFLLNALGPRSSISSELLETIEMYFGNADGLRKVQDQARALDQILASEAMFPRLRRIVVRIRVRTVEHPDFPADYSVPEVLASQIHRDMAVCSWRGLLLVP